MGKQPFFHTKRGTYRGVQESNRLFRRKEEPWALNGRIPIATQLKRQMMPTNNPGLVETMRTLKKQRELKKLCQTEEEALIETKEVLKEMQEVIRKTKGISKSSIGGCKTAPKNNKLSKLDLFSEIKKDINCNSDGITWLYSKEPSHPNKNDTLSASSNSRFGKVSLYPNGSDDDTHSQQAYAPTSLPNTNLVESQEPCEKTQVYHNQRVDKSEILEPSTYSFVSKSCVSLQLHQRNFIDNLQSVSEQTDYHRLNPQQIYVHPPLAHNPTHGSQQSNVGPVLALNPTNGPQQSYVSPPLALNPTHGPHWSNVVPSFALNPTHGYSVPDTRQNHYQPLNYSYPSVSTKEFNTMQNITFCKYIYTPNQTNVCQFQQILHPQTNVPTNTNVPPKPPCLTDSQKPQPLQRAENKHLNPSMDEKINMDDFDTSTFPSVMLVPKPSYDMFIHPPTKEEESMKPVFKELRCCGMSWKTDKPSYILHLTKLHGFSEECAKLFFSLLQYIPSSAGEMVCRRLVNRFEMEFRTLRKSQNLDISKVDQLTSEISRLQVQKKERMLELDSAKERLMQVESEKKRFCHLNDWLKEQRKEWILELDSAKDRLIQVESDNKRLDNLTSRLIEQEKEWILELKQVESENKRLNSLNNRMGEDLQHHEEQREKNEQENVRLQDQILQLKNLNQRLTEEKLSLLQKSLYSEDNKDKLKDDINIYKEKLLQVEDQLVRMQSVINNLEDKINLNIEDQNYMLSLNSERDTEIKLQVERIQKMEQENLQLLQDKESLELSLKSKEEKLKSNSELVQQLGEENRKTKTENLKLSEQNRSYGREKSEVEAKFHLIKEVSSKQEQELSSLRKESEEYRLKLDIVQSQNQSLYDRLQRVSAEAKYTITQMEETWEREKKNFSEEKKKLVFIKSLFNTQNYQEKLETGSTSKQDPLPQKEPKSEVGPTVEPADANETMDAARLLGLHRGLTTADSDFFQRAFQGRDSRNEDEAWTLGSSDKVRNTYSRALIDKYVNI